MSIQHLESINDPICKFLNIGCDTLVSNNQVASNYICGSAASAVGSLAPVNVGIMKMILVDVPGSSGNNITKQSGGLISMSHTNGSGIYNFTFAGFAEVPYINVQFANFLFGGKFSITSTSLQINVSSPGGGPTDGSFHLLIMGASS